MFIIVKFLLDSVFSHYKYLWVTLHPSSRIHAIHYFMAPSPDLLSASKYKLTWDDTSNTSHFSGITPSYIYLIKKGGSLLTKEVAIVVHVIEALKMDLDEQNIGVRYNAMRPM